MPDHPVVVFFLWFFVLYFVFSNWGPFSTSSESSAFSVECHAD